jgi:hypothetical protein
MNFRIYDYYQFNDIDNLVRVDFDYQKDIENSEEIASVVETFATGKFIVSLKYVLFEKSEDATMFALRYGHNV